jgi:hypothetical protein
MKSNVFKMLAATAALVGAGAAQAAVPVYFNDFETSAGAEWSNTTISTTPVGARKFLGQFGNDDVTLSLSGLGAHTSVTLEFDLFVIQSWDGSNTTWGPDFWGAQVTGGPILNLATFSNQGGPYMQQNLLPTPSGLLAPQTGASETGTLGYTSTGGVSLGGSQDSVYHFSHTFLDTSSSVQFQFYGAHLQAVSDESWGLDNVKVSVVPVPEAETWAMMLVGVGLVGFQLRRRGGRHSRKLS